MTGRDALAVLAALALARDRAGERAQLEEQNQLLFRQLQEVHDLSEQQMADDPRDLRPLRRASARATRRSPSIR